MPEDDLPARWRAFGWDVYEIDGHDELQIANAFSNLNCHVNGQPKVIIARNVKGKGVSFVEGHGPWHHRIPNNEEYQKIIAELS